MKGARRSRSIKQLEAREAQLTDRVAELEEHLADLEESRRAGLDADLGGVPMQYQRPVGPAHTRDAEAFHDDPNGFLKLIPVLIGFDPSLRMSAYAGVTLDGNLTPVTAGACPTEPSVKRTDFFLFRMLDDAKRARTVNRWAVEALLSVPPGHRVAAVAFESPSGIPTSFKKLKPGAPPRPKGWRPPQDASAFGKMVRAGQAVFDACAEAFDGHPIAVSTYGAKEAATGEKKPKRGKAEVAASVRRLFGPTVIDELVRGVRGASKGREGVIDALSVALAALETLPVRAEIEAYRRAQE